jgi:AcrR family transcriptional regulator
MEQVEKRKRLTREDWVDAATRTLLKRSIDGVRVELLAKDLNVSRGSFYWHFKSREELLSAILANWRERQTRRTIERIREEQDLTAEERLKRLRMKPTRTRASRDGATLELAIRAWARRDRMARDAVDAVDAERVEFSEALLEAAGATKAAARHWALLGHAYILGESLLRESMSDDDIDDCRRVLLDAQLVAIRGEAPAKTTPKAKKSPRKAALD